MLAGRPLLPQEISDSYHINKLGEKNGKESLKSLTEFFCLNIPDDFLPSLYLLHRVDLVSLQLQQLVDRILLWGNRTARKSHFRLRCCVAQSQHVKWEKLLYSPWVLPTESAQASLFKESNPDVSFRTSAEQTHNNVLLTDLPWELPPPCGIWALSRWPADQRDDGQISQAGLERRAKVKKSSPPQPPLQPSRSEATPGRAGIVSPWQPAGEWWPGGLCCGWLTDG